MALGDVAIERDACCCAPGRLPYSGSENAACAKVRSRPRDDDFTSHDYHSGVPTLLHEKTGQYTWKLK